MAWISLKGAICTPEMNVLAKHPHLPMPFVSTHDSLANHAQSNDEGVSLCTRFHFFFKFPTVFGRLVTRCSPTQFVILDERNATMVMMMRFGCRHRSNVMIAVGSRGRGEGKAIRARKKICLSTLTSHDSDISDSLTSRTEGDSTLGSRTQMHRDRLQICADVARELGAAPHCLLGRAGAAVQHVDITLGIVEACVQWVCICLLLSSRYCT